MQPALRRGKGLHVHSGWIYARQTQGFAHLGLISGRSADQDLRVRAGLEQGLDTL